MKITAKEFMEHKEKFKNKDMVITVEMTHNRKTEKIHAKGIEIVSINNSNEFTITDIEVQ